MKICHGNVWGINKKILLLFKTRFLPNLEALFSVQHDTLWFFNDQLCRALPMVYHATVQHKGLPSYRSPIFFIEKQNIL
jgi:hypothetical protein